MVAKAATKSGEFFCFHCGKPVGKQDPTCKSCSVSFDKTTEAFRCPRCSNLLPVGAAACPACGLGFKVRTISTAQKPSEDDKFLMKLIDWGKQPEAGQDQSRPMTRTVRAGGSKAPPPPPPPPPVQRKVVSEPTKPMVPRPPARQAQAAKSLEPSLRESGARKVEAAMDAEPVKSAPHVKIRPQKSVIEEEGKEPPAETVRGETTAVKPSGVKKEKLADIQKLIKRLEEAEENLRQSSARNIQILEMLKDRREPDAEEDESRSMDYSSIYDQLKAEMNEITLMEVQLQELRDYIHGDGKLSDDKGAIAPATEDDQGLSNQALKKLLDERDKELSGLRQREDEIARKEEHLNRKLREYATKMKEIGSIEAAQADRSQDAVQIGSTENELEIPDHLSIDDKNEWIKEQARIKSGLLEMRKQLNGQKKNDTISYIPSQIPGDIAEKVEVLEEKLADAARERDDLADKVSQMESINSDVVVLLRILDQLLGKLSPETIDEFSKSKDFKLYEKVLDELNI